ncbi:MAG: TlpA family protein disulfide reductase [Planctomycetaceae bacterium]|jgi:thiol-disulfide isomerase/thioredoxin|nr:TlpA family protein disulfide reductase [Planctomycetaceae bacterium]
MKTCFKFTTWTFVVFALSFPFVSAQSETKENGKISSLDDAKTIADVDKYIANVQAKSRSLDSISNEEERRNATAKYLTEWGEAFIKGGEKIISLTDDPAQQEEGVRKKIQGLRYLQMSESMSGLADPDASKSSQQLETYLEELAKEGKYKAVVNQERYTNLFLMKASNDLWSNLTLENVARYVQEAKKWANTEGIGPAGPFLIILEAVATPKASKLDPEIVKKTADEILAFVRSDELKVSEEKKKEAILLIEGFQKRLLGSNPELYGKTLDDQDFDWNKLRGKYVLIKFTASWCGPCKGEIPFMRKAYEKYHDKGFEIVSVYVWDTRDATKKVVEEEMLNWIILSEELTEKAGLPKQGTGYAIQGVPTMILVDKDGKIISTTVRGEELEKTLAKLFGETDPKNQDQTSD